MHTATKETEVSLTSADLARIKRWYQVYTMNVDVVLADADVVLDAKLRAARYGITDRDSASVFALRSGGTNTHVGPERRARTPARIRPRRADVTH